MSRRRPGRDRYVSPELARLRSEIDGLDRRLVGLINDRNRLVAAVGREKLAIGRRFVRDVEREREVLLRASIANEGPTPQADLLAIFRRVIASARALEAAEQDRFRHGDGPAEPPGA